MANVGTYGEYIRGCLTDNDKTGQETTTHMNLLYVYRTKYAHAVLCSSVHKGRTYSSTHQENHGHSPWACYQWNIDASIKYFDRSSL